MRKPYKEERAERRTSDQIAKEKVAFRMKYAEKLKIDNAARFEFYTKVCNLCVTPTPIVEMCEPLNATKGVVGGAVRKLLDFGCLRMNRINSNTTTYKLLKMPKMAEIEARFKEPKKGETHELSPGGVVYSFEKAGKLRDNYIEQCKIDRINRVSEKVYIDGGQTYAMW